MMSEHMDTIGQTKAFDGAILYLPIRLQDQVWTLMKLLFFRFGKFGSSMSKMVWRPQKMRSFSCKEIDVLIHMYKVYKGAIVVK